MPLRALPDPGMKSGSPASLGLQADSLPLEAMGEAREAFEFLVTRGMG